MKNPVNRIILFFLVASGLYSQELFTHRQPKPGISGEYSIYLIPVGNYPGYNDESGKRDKRLIGFKHEYNASRYRLLAQVLVHDDGHRRTKFDFHFSLRYKLHKNIVAIQGHDSNHDSDYSSYGRGWFLNRNYTGVGFPVNTGSIYIEPFTWVMWSNTNQVVASKRLKYEYGLRFGADIHKLVISLQAISQMNRAVLADVILRYSALTMGYRIWADSDKHYYSVYWGIGILF